MVLNQLEYRTEGFANQRLVVIPKPQIETSLSSPGTSALTVTDAGYFPSAYGHLRRRETGTPETIVILCVDGEGAVELGGQRLPLTRSAYVTIPPNTPHIYYSSEERPWTIWWMHIRGGQVQELTGPLLGSQPPLRRLRSLDRVVALFDELVGTLEKGPSPAHLLAASGIATHSLLRMAVDSVLPAEGSPIERAIRYLESRVDGSIQVPELAALVGLSTSHLSALFRQATGSGPGAFHKALKMAKARTLLDETSLSIAQVANAVGYSDPLYFSRHFRQIHHVNPSTYRSSHKG